MMDEQEQEQERFVPEPPIYTFRARILGCVAGYAPEDGTEIQREIEIAANSTLRRPRLRHPRCLQLRQRPSLVILPERQGVGQNDSEYAYQGAGAKKTTSRTCIDLFPEGSEMRKLVLLVNDPDFEPSGDFPAEIDRPALQTEIVAMLREAAITAPDEDRVLMEEFATLIAANPDADPAMLSEALGRYLAEDWEPLDAPDEPAALMPGFPDLDLAGLDLPGLDMAMLDEG